MCSGPESISASNPTRPTPTHIDSFKQLQSYVRKAILRIHPDVVQQYGSQVQEANQAAVSHLLAFVKAAEAAASSAGRKVRPRADQLPAPATFKAYVAQQGDAPLDSEGRPQLLSFTYSLKVPSTLLYRTQLPSKQSAGMPLATEWLQVATTAIDAILRRVGFRGMSLQLSPEQVQVLRDHHGGGTGRGQGSTANDGSGRRQGQPQPSQFAADRMVLEHLYYNDPASQGQWMTGSATPLHQASHLSPKQLDAAVGRFVTRSVSCSGLTPAQQASAIARFTGLCTRHFAALKLHELPWKRVRVVLGSAYLAVPSTFTLYVPWNFRDAQCIAFVQRHYPSMATTLLKAVATRPHAVPGQTDAFVGAARGGGDSGASRRGTGPLRDFVAGLRRPKP